MNSGGRSQLAAIGAFFQFGGMSMMVQSLAVHGIYKDKWDGVVAFVLWILGSVMRDISRR